MTPNLDAIRAALAAATPRPWVQGMPLSPDDIALIEDAPVWLASLISEVERLREQMAEMSDTLDRDLDEVERLRELVAASMVEHDAALAECERLRAELEAKS